MILFVRQVQKHATIDDPRAHRGDATRERQSRNRPLAPEMIQCKREGDEAPGDRGGAGTAVGLQHVAIDEDRALAQGCHVDRRRAGSARSDAGSRACGLRGPRRSRSMRSGELRGSIAYSAVTHPRPWPRRKGGTPSCTVAVQMTRVWPISISTEPSAGGRKPTDHPHRPDLVRAAAIGSHAPAGLNHFAYPADIGLDRRSTWRSA